MTTQAYKANTIMAYVGADAAVVGYIGTCVMPDWEGDKVYLIATTSPYWGIRQFDIDPDGIETLQKTPISLNVSGLYANAAPALSYDGDMLTFLASTGASVSIAQANAADLTLDTTFGTPSTSGTPSYGTSGAAVLAVINNPSYAATFARDVKAYITNLINTVAPLATVQGYITNWGNHTTSSSNAAAKAALLAASAALVLGVEGNSTSTLNQPIAMTYFNQSSVSYLLLATGTNVTGSTTPQLTVIPQAAFTPNTILGTLDETTALSGPLLSHGKAAAGTGPAFAVAFPTSHSAAVGVYSITSSAITKLGTFLPSNVDATWTNITTAYGVAHDETDGKPIIAVGTTDSVTNHYYIVKLSPTNGSVVWACAVNSLPTNSCGLRNSRIRNSKLHFIGASNTVYHINTSAGTATTETPATTIACTGAQCSDDVTDSIIFYGNFTPSGTPPSYAGTFMVTGGTTTLTSTWARLWFAKASGSDAPAPPPPPSSGGISSVNVGGLALSYKRAWTFTHDGHLFYVLDLGAEGTWVYDTTTREWSQFRTAGYQRWNVQRGCMWGETRIVGGSLDTTTVWEVAASELQDDTTNIPHIATGIITARNATHSVAAARITGSVGNLGDVTGSTINLRYSDNQGRTWSDYFSVALTQGDYDAEIAWRALGSFAAPGRIFEVSDEGGPVRIDALDVAIDNFDEDGGG
jgi:hypothetical protein